MALTQHVARTLCGTFRLHRLTVMALPCLILALGFSFLCGCAGIPAQGQGISTGTLDGLHKEGIQAPVDVASDFREQTKGKVAALTALSLLGGSAHFGQRNQQPADGYTVTQGVTTVFNGKEQWAYTDASSAMTEALRRKLPGIGIDLSAHSDYSMRVAEIFWGIDYEKLTEKDGYRLYYSITTVLKDGKQVVATHSCTGATSDKGSYEYWMDNDKRNVRAHATVIGSICADRALTAFDLKPSPSMANLTHQP